LEGLTRCVVLDKDPLGFQGEAGKAGKAIEGLEGITGATCVAPELEVREMIRVHLVPVDQPPVRPANSTPDARPGLD
jgi:hypothetical protein